MEEHWLSKGNYYWGGPIKYDPCGRRTMPEDWPFSSKNWHRLETPEPFEWLFAE
jgi:hypothetical protein